MDTVSNVLVHGQKPVVTTFVDRFMSHKNLCGINAIVAIASHSGYNQEDAILMNKSSMEHGMFLSVYSKCFKDDEKRNSNNGAEEVFCNPTNHTTSNLKSCVYSKLNSKGHVPCGTTVGYSDAIIGKVLTTKEDKCGICYKDCTTILKNKCGKGKVVRTLVDFNHEGYRFCKVKVSYERQPQVGDKFSSRHGQKGTCGKLLERYQMPYTANGLVPDLIINPHAIPSRMTLGQVLESLVGKAGLLNGKCMDGSPFGDTLNLIDRCSSILVNNGYSSCGSETFYNGVTGKKIKTKLFVGPVYYQKLKHMVQNKVHARAYGPMVLLTRQPAEGRSRDGGLRFGEMERDCMLAHGAMYALKERMVDCSDGYIVCICSTCGSFGIQNPSNNVKECLECQSFSNIYRIKIPYCAKLFFQELKTMCIDVRMCLCRK
jgi:DNA-directed RNA polymerase II subunit RPB2